jgi:hypothetical protein
VELALLLVALVDQDEELVELVLLLIVVDAQCVNVLFAKVCWSFWIVSLVNMLN